MVELLLCVNREVLSDETTLCVNRGVLSDETTLCVNREALSDDTTVCVNREAQHLVWTKEKRSHLSMANKCIVIVHSPEG